jgi:hypothetical protein
MPLLPPDSESPLRQILREVSSVPYRPIATLADAQREEDGYAVLEGDDGGMIYVVAPARTVKTGEDGLSALLQDLDEIAWSGGQPDMRQIYFEKRGPGIVPGGMGGGEASGQVWIHRQFRGTRIGAEIVAVLDGKIARITRKNT